MQRVSYAGESFLTGSAIAHALLAYAQALAQAGEAATVVIPTILPDGRAGTAEVLVGPASQLVAVTVEVELPDPENAELVSAIDAQTARLRSQSAPTAASYIDLPKSDDRYFNDYGI